MIEILKPLRHEVSHEDQLEELDQNHPMAHVLLQQDRWIVQLRVGEGPEGEAQKLRSFVLVKKDSWHVCDKSKRDEISTSNLYAKRANLCMASLKVSFSAGSTKKNPRSGVNHAKDR